MDVKAYSEETFSIAKDDLVDARRLYENRRYNNAVYHLQQSVEKIAKSIAVETGILSKNDAFKVSHRTFDIFKIIRRKITKFFMKKELLELGLNSKSFIKLVERMDTYKEGEFQEFIDVILKTWNRASKDSNKIKLSDKELETYINELKLIKELYLKGRPYIQNLTFNEPEVVHFKEWFIESCSNLILEIAIKMDKNTNKETLALNKTDIDDVFDKEIQKLIDNGSLKKLLLAVIDLFFVSSSLFYLSVLTQPHVNSTRYVKSNTSPRQVYTNVLPMIKEFNFLLETTEMTVDILSGKYEKYGLAPSNEVELKSLIEESTVSSD